MSKENKKVQAAGAAILVNAKVGDFRKGTRNRADRLVEAVKPITDAWYPRMRQAARSGAAELIATWDEFYGAMFGVDYRTADCFFRYAAMKLTLNSLEYETYGVDGAVVYPAGVETLIQHLQHFIGLAAHTRGGEFGGTLRGDALALWVSLVYDIDTLGLEYAEVA